MSGLTYGFVKQMPQTSFDEVVPRVIAALGEEGFGVLTKIDVKETLKRRLDVHFRRYLILGACNAPLAFGALQSEPHIGLLLPCNVLIQDAENGVIVSVVNPIAMLELVESSGLESIAREVRRRLACMLDRLA